jgi:hypothetical protein
MDLGFFTTAVFLIDWRGASGFMNGGVSEVYESGKTSG